MGIVKMKTLGRVCLLVLVLLVQVRVRVRRRYAAGQFEFVAVPLTHSAIEYPIRAMIDRVNHKRDHTQRHNRRRKASDTRELRQVLGAHFAGEMHL